MKNLIKEITNKIVIKKNLKVLKKTFNPVTKLYEEIQDRRGICRDGIIFKKKDQEFEEEFKELREKIIEYVKKNINNNPIIFSQTKVYVVIDYKKNEIISSYPSALFSRLNEENFINKNFLDYKKLYNFDYYVNYLYDFLFWPLVQNLSRRMKFEFIDSYLKYENSMVNEENFPKRFSSEPNQNIQQNSIVLGFLEKSDASLYQKQILLKEISFDTTEMRKQLNTLKRLYFHLRKKKMSGTMRQKRYIHSKKRSVLKIKPMNLTDLKNSLKESKYFEDFEKNSISNILVLIPQFFLYEKKKLFFMFDRKKVIENFPITMLSKNGFFQPLYQTKPLKKKQVLKNSKYFKSLRIPLKDLDNETLFTFLNKTDYDKLCKKDKKGVYFYKEKKTIITPIDKYEFNDERDMGQFQNAIYRQRQNYLEKLGALLLKIKNKVRNLKKLILIKNFINDNFDEPFLLEKTSYYIDKIKRKKISIIKNK